MPCYCCRAHDHHDGGDKQLPGVPAGSPGRPPRALLVPVRREGTAARVGEMIRRGQHHDLHRSVSVILLSNLWRRPVHGPGRRACGSGGGNEAYRHGGYGVSGDPSPRSSMPGDRWAAPASTLRETTKEERKRKGEVAELRIPRAMRPQPPPPSPQAPVFAPPRA